MAVGYRGGLITGKIGGDVGYMVKNAKGRVSQGWRAYQAHVSNPNNYSQRYNRVLLASMARAYSILRPICDHSFEGVSGASRNQKEFAKVNMPILQDLARNGLGNFNEKGNFAGLINPLYVSKGSLPSWEVLFPTLTGGPVIANLPSAIVGLPDEVTLGMFFDAMGWNDSGQITLCWAETEGGADITRFRYARYVFKLGERYAGSDSSEVATRDTPLFTVLTHDENPEYLIAYNTSESIGVQNIKLAPVTSSDDVMVQFQFGNLIADSANFELGAVSVINSALVGNSWKRSTQYLTVANDSEVGYELSRAIASYASTKDSSLYLNN